MEKDIKSLISRMTLAEKASLCSGLSFWETQPIKRLDIPSIMMCDGPHGLRKQINRDSPDVQTIPATCFPPAVGLASSWNVELLKRVGQAIGQECRKENVSIVLGPGVNLKRSPLCGRNFEYFSEDPVLSGELGAAWINGVQSQGVGTSLKHFTANNQEYQRMSIDVQIDERTLHETYLVAFERAVKQSKPWTLMCAYNKLNGDLCSENKMLLTDILRAQWGYEGLVMSDWGAVDQRPRALEAGLELQMPDVNGISDQDIVKAVEAGTLEMAVLDQAVERYLNLLLKAEASDKKEVVFSPEKNHKIAKAAAAESIVLLKNEADILPLSAKTPKVAVIGEFAKKPRIQGGGSSRVIPTKSELPFDMICQIAEDSCDVRYAAGYELGNDEGVPILLEDAQDLASTSDVAVLFVGLPENYESEAYDRSHMELPPSHTELIEAVCEVQENVIVVLTQGSTTVMSQWHNRVKGIIVGWLLGQGGASAMAEILWGKTCPSGKLAETLPLKLSDNPSFLNFPGKKGVVSYKEGIFIGYRYYDFKEMEVQYPFGYGLSYTEFEYSNLRLSHKEIQDTDTVNVEVTIKNTGNFFGKEIVQLYVSDPECQEIRPLKELKAFTKVALAPEEEQTVYFSLSYRDFAYYNIDIHDWTVETGEFQLKVGQSSRHICLTETIHVKSTQTRSYHFDRHSTLGEISNFSPYKEWAESMMDEFRRALMGETPTQEDDEHLSPEMVEAMVRFLPLRSLYHWSKGAHTYEMMEEMLQKLNGAEP